MINEEPTMSAGNGGFSGSAAAKGPVERPRGRRRAWQAPPTKEDPRGGRGRDGRVSLCDIIAIIVQMCTLYTECAK